VKCELLFLPHSVLLFLTLKIKIVQELSYRTEKGAKKFICEQVGESKEVTKNG